MSYNYETEKLRIYTPEGIGMLMKVFTNVNELHKASGAFKASNAWRGITGDVWLMLACLDLLVENGYIREIVGDNTAGQDRVFICIKDRL